ncbi:hypothetical protein ACFL1B_01505 [Nanoarchaeota archaeon]
MIIKFSFRFFEVVSMDEELFGNHYGDDDDRDADFDPDSDDD